MKFGPKTTHYLRITRGTVLPLYLYLDDRHIEWMSERTLQYVLTDLRPLIPEKLELERARLLGSTAATKFQSKVETYRGDTYQFGWWFTQAEPHAMVLKTRTFERTPPSAAQPEQHLGDSEDVFTPQKSKRKHVRSSQNSRTTKKRDRSANEGTSSGGLRDDEPIDVDEQDEFNQTLPQASLSRPVKVEDDDEYIPDGDVPVSVPRQRTARTVTVHFATAEEEDEKKKPVLKLGFQNFIPRIALCLVIEPWPLMPTNRRQVSVFSLGGVRAMTRAPSDAPSVLVPQAREETPLFLPDFERDTATPAPFLRQPSIPASSAFTNGEVVPAPVLEELDLMQFTQAVQATDIARGCSPEEQFVDYDDVLYGDADEARTAQ